MDVIVDIQVNGDITALTQLVEVEDTPSLEELEVQVEPLLSPEELLL